MYDLIVRNGRVVTGSGITEADIAIQDGRIVAVGIVPDEAREDLDAAGKLVMPGVIDTQVHFREPGLTYKEDIQTGSRAALLGGVTSFLEMPNTDPPTVTPEALRDKLARAEGRAWANYGFFMGATAENAARLAEYEKLPGTPGIKMFMGSSTGGLLVADDEGVRAVLSNGRRPVPVHAEDEPTNRAARAAYTGHDPFDHRDVRSPESALLATSRLLRIVEETRRPVHVLHVSTAEECDLLADAKRRGMAVTCEVTPQHLFFDERDLRRDGTRLQMNPPVRGGRHRARLRQALAEGLFDVFGSDHAPHTLDEKARPYPASPSGMPGVQTLLPLLLHFAAEGLITYETVARMASERPAELYGVTGKGCITEGLDADLVLVDPLRETTWTDAMSASRSGWTPYAGRTTTGTVETVILDGRIAALNGATVGEPGGRMLAFA